MTNIVILTGAGISAESGLQTFRDANGLWEGHNIDDVCTLDAFARQPDVVHSFYDARRRSLVDAEPNAAHFALADLQNRWKGGFMLITQNVDDLHERGGSRDVIHMHGQLRSALCGACFSVVSWDVDLPTGSVCPSCSEPSLRPNVVFFQEIPYYQSEIYAAVEKADIFVSIGTSGVVYPAAGLVSQARRNGARTIEINLKLTGNTDFLEVAQGPASVTVPAVVANLLA